MISRHEKRLIADEAERVLEAEVRRRDAAQGPSGTGGPPDHYWQNLPVRVNERIDRATSGKALSISWAARVAIPGAVAIMSFLVGLHYYVPEPPASEVTVTTVVLSLPNTAIDSILADPGRVDPSLSIAEAGPDVFDVSREQIADYLVASGNTTAAVEGLTEKETGKLLAALGTGER